MNYYNEYDPYAAAWLRELIARKLIPAGHVDERSITEITPQDLDGYTQCHFFAGIGLCPLALRLAGWPESRLVWTASLPCQPFSAAGSGEGAQDDRHLFPVFHRLVQVKRPERVFGEQVAQAIGFDWLDGVSTEMESEAYTVGAVVLGAHSVGAPHIRKRLYWVADSQDSNRRSELEAERAGSGGSGLAGSRIAGRLPDAIGAGLEGHAGDERDGSEPGRIDTLAAGSTAEGCAIVLGLADDHSDGREQERKNLHETGNDGAIGNGSWSDRLADAEHDGGRADEQGRGSQGRAVDGWSGSWSDTRVIECRDGKLRKVPVEPCLFPLAHDGQYVVQGVARRRSIRPPLLRGAGNAIVPQVAAEFIQACEEAFNQS